MPRAIKVVQRNPVKILLDPIPPTGDFAPRHECRDDYYEVEGLVVRIRALWRISENVLRFVAGGRSRVEVFSDHRHSQPLPREKHVSRYYGCTRVWEWGRTDCSDLGGTLGWKLLDRCLVEKIAEAARIEPQVAEKFDERPDPWFDRLANLLWQYPGGRGYIAGPLPGTV